MSTRQFSLWHLFTVVTLVCVATAGIQFVSTDSPEIQFSIATASLSIGIVGFGCIAMSAFALFTVVATDAGFSSFERLRPSLILALDWSRIDHSIFFRTIPVSHTQILSHGRQRKVLSIDFATETMTMWSTMIYRVDADMSRTRSTYKRNIFAEALDSIVPNSGCVGLQGGPHDEVFFLS